MEFLNGPGKLFDVLMRSLLKAGRCNDIADLFDVSIRSLLKAGHRNEVADLFDVLIRSCLLEEDRHEEAKALYATLHDERERYRILSWQT